MTMLEVLRQIVERGDIIPDTELTSGVWHTIEFSVFTTEDDLVFFDDTSVTLGKGGV